MTVYYKMRQLFYYKMRQFYYKTQVISNCNDFITKCDSYYKMRRLLQIVTVKLEISRVQEWVFHSLLK